MTTDNGHEFLNYNKIETSKYNEKPRKILGFVSANKKFEE